MRFSWTPPDEKTTGSWIAATKTPSSSRSNIFSARQGVNTIPRLVLTEGDLQNCRRRGTARRAFRCRRTVDEPRADFAPPLTAKSSPNLKNRRRATKFSTAAKRSAAGRFCSGRRRIIFRVRTTTRSCCSEIFPAREFCCCPIWAAPVKAPCSRARMICARTLSIAGLPNEGEPLGDALLDAIQPKVIVIADSEFPATRRASRELKERLAGRNVPVIYTRTSGAVTIVADRTVGNCRRWTGRISDLRSGHAGRMSSLIFSFENQSRLTSAATIFVHCNGNVPRLRNREFFHLDRDALRFELRQNHVGDVGGKFLDQLPARARRRISRAAA